MSPSRTVNVAFYLLLLIITLNLNGVLYAFYEISSFFSPILLVCSLIVLFGLRNGRFMVNSDTRRFMVYIILYYVLGSLAITVNDGYDVELGSFLRKSLPSLVIVAVTYMFLYTKHTTGKFKQTLNILAWLMFISSTLIIVANLTGMQESGNYSDQNRFSGFFVNPNQAGLCTNFTLALLLYNLQNAKKLGFYALILAILITLYSCILTFSKSAIIVSLLLISSYGAFQVLGKGFDRSHSSRAIIGLLLVVGSIILAYDRYGSDFLTKLNEGQSRRLDYTMEIVRGQVNREVTSGRSDLLAHGMDLIKENPIVGYGLGTFVAFEKYDVGVHNQFLQVWGEAGIIAFIVYCWLFIGLLISSLRIAETRTKILSVHITLIIVLYGTNTHAIFNEQMINIFLGVLLVILTCSINREVQNKISIQNPRTKPHAKLLSTR